MTKLLLLSAGTNACYHIAKTIKGCFGNEFMIIGADINEGWLIPTYPYLDSFYKVPFSSDTGYYQIILDICIKEKVDFLIPSFDADQQLFYPENPDLRAIGTTSFGTGKKALPYYVDKVRMNEFLVSHGFPIPQIYRLDQCLPDVEYVVKPIHGVGSIGSSIKKGLALTGIEEDEYVIQERCFDPEVTMECFHYQGRFSSVCRERIATKAGVCTKARVYKNMELEAIGKRFAEELGAPHFFNLQFMVTAEGTPVITDVNLRTAGGMSLSYATGWDEVTALAKIMLGKKVEDVFSTLPSLMPEQFVMRAYTDIVTRKAVPVVAFDLDGTLLDSRARHGVVLQDILSKYEIELDTSDLISFKREGKNNISWLESKGVDAVLARQVQKEWIEHIESPEYLVLDRLYEDSEELLQEYDGCKRILITARSQENAVREQVKLLGLEPWFDEVFVVPSCETTSQLKADVLKEQNALLMIGDTKSDAEAAHKAGIGYRHIDHGFHSRTFVEV